MQHAPLNIFSKSGKRKELKVREKSERRIRRGGSEHGRGRGGRRGRRGTRRDTHLTSVVKVHQRRKRRGEKTKIKIKRRKRGKR